MTAYRYLFYDLLTNVALAELELTNVNFSKQLNSAGTFTGEIIISDTSETVQNILDNTQTGKTALYVERSDPDNNISPSLVWGGIIWNRAYDSTSQRITFTAREFESFFEKLLVLPSNFAPFGYTTDGIAIKFANTDQLLLAQLLINTAQGIAPSPTNIGVQVTGATSTQNVSKTYYSYENKTYYQAILDLSQSQNGFDFNIDVYYDAAGVPQKIFNIGYPQLGTRYNANSTTAIVVQMPGNMVDYKYEEDSADQVNLAYVTGQGSNEAQLISSASGQTTLLPRYPWPQYQGVFNYSDITDTNLLSLLAQGRIAATDYPINHLSATVTGRAHPYVGFYNPADDVRVIITDSRFPTTLDAIYRLVGMTVSPGENNAAELVSMSLTLPTNVY